MQRSHLAPTKGFSRPSPEELSHLSSGYLGQVLKPTHLPSILVPPFLLLAIVPRRLPDMTSQDESLMSSVDSPSHTWFSRQDHSLPSSKCREATTGRDTDSALFLRVYAVQLIGEIQQLRSTDDRTCMCWDNQSAYVRAGRARESLLPRRMFENIGLESSWRMHAIGEQQSKWTQSGSNSRSGRNREQQLKRTQAASMQQQLKRAQSGSSSWKQGWKRTPTRSSG